MEDGAYRTHERVKLFIKRHLGQDICDALRSSESCIVVGESYGHAFKFVALTDNTLFILANPPQAENDIELRIELQHINDVQHVHDIPDFLSGELQKNAQHFSVTYTKTTPILKLPGQQNLSLRSNQKSEHNLNGSRSSNLHGKVLSETSIRSKASRPSDKQLFSGLLTTSDVFDDDSGSERASTIRFKIDLDVPESRERSYSDPIGVTDLPAEAKAALAVPLKLSTSQNLPKDSVTTTSLREVKSHTGRSRPLPPPAPGTEMTNARTIKYSPNLRASGRRRRTSDRKTGGDRSDKIQFDSQTRSDPYLLEVDGSKSPASRHKSYPLDSFSHDQIHNSMANSLHSLQNENDKLSQNPSQSFSARIGSFFGKTDDKVTLKGRSGDSKFAVNQSDTANEDDVFSSENKEKKIDIYLLKGDSPFILLLKSTRINSIMLKTFRMSFKKERSTCMESSKLLEEFNHLKEEILNCTEIEKAFILTKELLSGSMNKPFIKKLFWKTQELLNYYITTLEAYQINHSEIVFQGDEADELDFMLIIADLVNSMIFSTEFLASRNKILFGHRGSLITKIMKTSLMKPDLLKKKESQVLSNAAALLLAGVDQQQKRSEKEIELNNLLGEWTDASSSVVYELLNATEQCTWTYREGKGISLHDLIRIMENHPHIEAFLNDVMGRILDRLLKDRLAIKYSDVILLFKQFSVLQYIFDNSLTLSKYISDDYYEEFRYYIGSPKAVSRIPDCPLAPMLRALVSEVISLAVNN